MQPTTDRADSSEATSSHPVKTDLQSTENATNSNKNVFIIGGFILVIFFLICIGILVVFMIFIKNGNSKEDEYVKFIQDSIVNNEKPTIFSVSNNTNNDKNFISFLELLRDVVREGGFSEVSAYKDCQIITNSTRYNTEELAKFCVAKLCTTDGLECIYIVGYSNNHGNKSTLRSFGFFDNQEKVDIELESLLSS